MAEPGLEGLEPVTDPALIAMLEQPQSAINKGGGGSQPAYSQSAIDAFDRAISTAQRLKSHPGFGAAVGSGFDPQSWGSFNPLTGGAFAGTSARDFGSELDAMKAQVFLPMVQSMKGMGALSNAEGEKLTAAIGALDPGMSEDAFRASLDRIIGDLTTYRNRGVPQQQEQQQGAPPSPTPQQDSGPPMLAGTAPQSDTSRVVIEDRSAPVQRAQDTGIIGERGGTSVVSLPQLAGANAAVNTMLKARVPAADILEYLRERGATPEALQDIAGKISRIQQWQTQNPAYKGGFKVDIERVEVPNTAWQNFANSDVGVGALSAADAATGFTTDNVVNLVGGDGNAARASLEASQAAHPKSALAGTVAGGVGGALAAEAALAKTGLTGAGRALAGDVAYGTVAGAGSTDVNPDGTAATVGDRLMGAGKGAVAATVGNMAGNAVAAGAKRLANGSSDPYVSAVNSEGIPTTIGQQYGQGRLGGIIKRTEDRIAGLPVIGDLINARRAEGIKVFNQRAFDHALKPIGANIGERVGEDAIDYAQDAVSQAFQRALAGKSATVDKQFGTDLTKAITDAWSLPRVGDEVADQVKTILQPYMQGQSFTGEAMQQISRELRDLKAGYFQANEPMKKRIGDEIDKVEGAIFGLFRRQAPEVLPAYNKAKVAQRRLYTLADAVNKAKNREGIFMPSQLGAADKAATVKTEGKVSAARGRGQFQKLQRAAQEVLPSEVPDSGTVGRLAVPAVALGVGGTSDATGATGGAGTTLAAILSLAYTRAGQRILTKPGRGVGGKAGKLLQSDGTKRALTAGGASTGALIANQ